MTENTERTAEIAGWIRDDIFAGRDAGESLYPVSERLAARIVAALSRPVPDDTAKYAHEGHDLIELPGDPTFCATCGHDVMGKGECGTSVVPVTEGVDLEAIEARTNAATEGPWRESTQGGIESVHYAGPGEVTNSVAQTRNQGDADFVSHAREDIPALVAEIRALRSRLSPPTREALARVIHDADVPTMGYERRYPDETEETGFNIESWRLYLTHADAVLAFLSSPDTEGESA